jgi:hypothetical protein
LCLGFSNYRAKIYSIKTRTWSALYVLLETECSRMDQVVKQMGKLGARPSDGCIARHAAAVAQARRGVTGARRSSWIDADFLPPFARAERGRVLALGDVAKAMLKPENT